MMTENTEQARDRWAAVAAAWERNADMVTRSTKSVIDWLVEHLDPHPGQTVLELAAGPGDTGFAVAQRLGPRGRLYSSDIVPEMLDAARRRAAKFGIDNVDFRVIDAQHIDLPDDSVDGILHRFGPMLLPDPMSGFTEARRVLRDGGRYVCAVWSGAEANSWTHSGMVTLAQHGIEVPEIDVYEPGGMFSLEDPERLEQMLRAGGFGDVPNGNPRLRVGVLGLRSAVAAPIGDLGPHIKRHPHARRRRARRGQANLRRVERAVQDPGRLPDPEPHPLRAGAVATAMDVRPITTNDITRAAEVLADAFLDDPFTMWLFPEERRRERALRSWTKQLSVVYVPKGLASMTSGGEGVALWSSPSGWRLSAGQQVRLLLSYIGILGAHRLPKAAAGFSVIEKAHPAEPHWYLSAIGVDPLRQRAGAGSALIRPMLDRADAERTIVHLETFKARNVPYYQRFGFEVTAEDDIREGPHMWAMARRPLAGPT